MHLLFGALTAYLYVSFRAYGVGFPHVPTCAGLTLHLYHDRDAVNSGSYLFTYLMRLGVFDDIATLPKVLRVEASGCVRVIQPAY